jgi:hypothetical protein
MARGAPQVLAEFAFVLLAPAAAVLMFDISLVNQDRYVDPWLYTGYGQNFDVLHALYGWPYYAVRFPVIMLIAAFERPLDPIVGYALLRYVLILLSGGLLYLWSRRNFGVAIAVTSYLFLFCNPLFPRVVLWDLTTFVSVPLALAGMALWLLPDRPYWVDRFAVGFLFCASIASHAFTGTAIGLFVIVEGLRTLARREFVRFGLYDVFATTLGAAACFGIGVLYYYSHVGRFDPAVVFTATISAISAGDTYTKVHGHRSISWLLAGTFVYIPYALLLASGLGLGRRILSDEMSARIWRFAALYALALAIYQFGFGSFVLEIFYYFAHLTIIVYFLFPICLVLLARSGSIGAKTAAAAAASLVLIAVPLARRSVPNLVDAMPAVLTSSWAILAILLAGFLLSTFAVWRAPRSGIAITGAAFVLAAAVQLATFSTPVHSALYASRYEAREVGLYRTAVDVLHIFAAHARPDARVMFWYPNRETSALSIASTGLVFDLQDPWSGLGMPTFGDHERERLRSPGLRYLMLLSEHADENPAGVEALAREGIQVREVERRTIIHEPYVLYLDLVELQG